MVEMHLAAVKVERPTSTPILLLQEVSGAERTLPIYIGANEATAIAYALRGVVTPRPMTTTCCGTCWRTWEPPWSAW